MTLVNPDLDIHISKELLDYIAPLTSEELTQLEVNLISNGCREPLTVWQKTATQLILVDGHNRYKICQKNHIPFSVVKVFFDDISEVKMWMVDNQIGRRNLNSDQLSYYRGLKYLALKKSKGGYKNVKLKGKTEPQTSAILSERFNVSDSTIKRDSRYAEGLNIISKSNPKLKLKILLGEAKVKKADVQILADATDSDTLTIKNEADLYNKAAKIRNDILDNAEVSLKKINQEKIDRAQKVIQDFEPAFLPKEDRIRKIKGMIISSINRAINQKDIGAIAELKRLIDGLEEILFD